MAQLNIGAIKDLGGIGGFTFTSGGITCNVLNVTNIMIDGMIAGSSALILPNPSGHAEEYISNNGSKSTWGNLSTASGARSMQVWTENGTWNKPESSVKTICVFCTGAGGGRSGHGEGGGAGGTAVRQLDVTNISSVSVTIGNPVST